MSMLRFRVIGRALISIISLMCIPKQVTPLFLIVFLPVTATFLLFLIITLISSICVIRWKLSLLRCQLVFGVNLIMISINLSLNMEAKTGLLLLVLLIVIVMYLMLAKLSSRRRKK